MAGKLRCPLYSLRRPSDSTFTRRFCPSNWTRHCSRSPCAVARKATTYLSPFLLSGEGATTPQLRRQSGLNLPQFDRPPDTLLAPMPPARSRSKNKSRRQPSDSLAGHALRIALDANAAAYRHAVRTSAPGDCWDYLVLTAANEKQAEGYRLELASRARAAGPAG